MDTSTRPDWHESWPEVPDGHEVTAVPDPDWAVAGPGRTCRRAFGRGTRACGEPAVAVLYRGERGQPWGYCATHACGRWVEGAIIMHWVLRKKGGPS
jgi:hypothetical protein